MNVLCELCHEYAEKELQVIPGTIANNNYFCLVKFSFVYCKFIRVHVIFAMTFVVNKVVRVSPKLTMG